MMTDPYAIFAAAQQYWQAAVYPKEVAYGVTVRVADRGVTSEAHYHVRFDALSNSVSETPASDEELAHPYTPHGINTFLSVFGGGVSMSAPQHTFDYLGLPILAPAYSFGIMPAGPPNTQRNDMALVREIRAEFHDPAPPAKSQSRSGLKTIAEVAVTHRRYVIGFAGIEAVNGHDDYHLTLKPVEQPSLYRLRDMWVDAQSYATDRLVTDGDFTSPGPADVRWQIDYRQIKNAPFIASETALSGFTWERRHYDSAVVEFTDVASVSGALFPASARSVMAAPSPSTLTEPLKPRVRR